MKTRVFMTLMLVAVLVTLCSCAQIQKAIGATGERNNHADNDPEKAEFSTSAIASTIADETASEIVSSANPTEEETASETADHADPTESEQEQNDAALTQKQANSIAMLNYLAMISQEIESAKDTHNSRLILEDVYSSLLNNTNPDKLDEKSQFHLTNLLDIIEDYRVIAIKRERLQLLYDQEKASIMKTTIHSALEGLFIPDTAKLSELAANVTFSAIDSFNRYKSASAELDKLFMLSGWELDDKETESIHNNRKKAFNYMVDIVRDYNLPGNLALSEEAVQDFVIQMNNENVFQRLQFLESKENVYKEFGEYWLVLADSYYETENYLKCLNCIEQYEKLYTGIFRKDYSYAERLPKAIVAAQHIYAESTYIEETTAFTDAIKENARSSDWALLYFAAQSYLDLYQKTNDKSYLIEAYNIALDNVNYLVREQTKNNTTYVNELEELKLDVLRNNPGVTEEEKKEQEQKQKDEQEKLDALNKSLKEKRKTELPTLYEPLLLNCDLLFAIADNLEISNAEKAKIEGILQSNGSSVFLTRPISNHYSFSSTESFPADASLETDSLTISADLLCEGAVVTATVEDYNGLTVFNDWTITKVERQGEDVSSFIAQYESEAMDDYTWTDGANVTISIGYKDYCEPLVLKYIVKYTENWWILPDTVEFIMQ